MIALNLSIPTHIIVGSQEQTAQATVDLLRAQWCKQGGADCFCSACKQISHHQHRFLAWIKPTKDYTVDDLVVIFQTTSFSLDDNQTFFFVLEQSEKLTPATANRLLKSLEEPHAGYHFILLTDNLNALLPTIISRAEVITLTRAEMSEAHPLVSFFLRGAPITAVQEFEQLLQRNKFSDSDSLQLLDELFEHLQIKLATAVEAEDRSYPSRRDFAAPQDERSQEDTQTDYLMAATSCVHKAMAMPPQSGSSDLFWKQLWVSFPRP